MEQGTLDGIRVLTEEERREAALTEEDVRRLLQRQEIRARARDVVIPVNCCFQAGAK